MAIPRTGCYYSRELELRGVAPYPVNVLGGLRAQ